MRKIVGPLAIAALLLSGTDSHALRTGSSKTLTVQNGAATVGCTADVGTSASLLYDADGQTATNPATCLAIPSCSAGNYLRWQGSALECTAPSASTSVAPLIVTQSETPIAANGTAGTLFMGLGGTLRNTNVSLHQIQGTATFKNLRCNTNLPVTAGQTMTVEFGYITTYLQGSSTGFTSFSPAYTVTIDGTNNTNGPTNTNTTAAATPSGAWIGYKLSYSSNFPDATGGEAQVSCSIERAS